MPISTIQNFVDTVAAKANIDPAAAETAVGTILSLIQQEADAAKVAQVFAKIPGAAELAQQHTVTVGSGGGLLGGLSDLASSVMGKNAGLLAAGLVQIESTGLSFGQIKNVGNALLTYIKGAVDPALFTQIINSVPGLKEHFGH